MHIRLLFTIIIFTPLFSKAQQAFTFVERIAPIDTSIEASKSLTDTIGFKFNIDFDTLFFSNSGCGIIKKNSGNTIINTSIDFGYKYVIYRLGYFVFGDRVYFVFFIREGGYDRDDPRKDYAALYSFTKNKLDGMKRIHFVNCFELKSSVLEKNHLKLNFSNKSYNIDLIKGLFKEDAKCDIE